MQGDAEDAESLKVSLVTTRSDPPRPLLLSVGIGFTIYPSLADIPEGSIVGADPSVSLFSFEKSQET